MRNAVIIGLAIVGGLAGSFLPRTRWHQELKKAKSASKLTLGYALFRLPEELLPLTGFAVTFIIYCIAHFRVFEHSGPLLGLRVSLVDASWLAVDMLCFAMALFAFCFVGYPVRAILQPIVRFLRLDRLLGSETFLKLNAYSEEPAIEGLSCRETR
jgi:hypothetical protein